MCQRRRSIVARHIEGVAAVLLRRWPQRGSIMASEHRLTVAVTYDESRGYVGSAPELRQPVVALSLGGLRRKVEIAMLPDEVVVLLSLDRTARLERDRRRLTGRRRRGLAGTSS